MIKVNFLKESFIPAIVLFPKCQVHIYKRRICEQRAQDDSGRPGPGLGRICAVWELRRKWAFESRGRCRQSVWDLGEGGAVRLGSRVKWSHPVVRAVEGVEGVSDVVLVVMGMAGGLLACLAILGAAQVNAIKWLWVTILNSVWITSLSKLLFGYYKRWPKTWFEVVGLFDNFRWYKVQSFWVKVMRQSFWLF